MLYANLSKLTRVVLAMILPLLALTLLISSVSAQTLHTLHTFGQPSGGTFPSGRLLADAAGNLYGATPSGGTSRKGMIFKFTP